LGRVVFPRPAEPAVDWSEIESRLRDISNSFDASSDLTIEPAVIMANDPPAFIIHSASIEPIASVANNLPASNDLSAATPRDSLGKLSPLAAVFSNRS
jgi:hypothetical protein